MNMISALSFQTVFESLQGSGYALQKNALGQWQLLSPDERVNPLEIDFTTGKSRHRRLFGGGVKQPLAKAVGIKQQYRPSILDLTAGLGRDAFVLATLGCQITMNERVPVIAFLLEQALQIAHADKVAKEITSRMTLCFGDSLLLLNALDNQAFETIYLDPMYPHRTKSALVKKEMRIFRDLAGTDEDSAQLLEKAREVAGKRVVVKRPKGGDRLGGVKANFEINSPNTRYDIYLPI